MPLFGDHNVIFNTNANTAIGSGNIVFIRDIEPRFYGKHHAWGKQARRRFVQAVGAHIV